MTGLPLQLLCGTCALTALAGCGATVSPPLPASGHFPERSVPAVADTASPDPSDTTSPDNLDDLWTPDQIGASLTTLFVDDVPNGHDLIDLFRALASEGDSRCPGDDLGFTTPESSCVSGTGWEYFGFAPYLDEVSTRTGEETHTVAIPQASFIITAPDGRTFSAGGGFIHEQRTDDSGIWEQIFTGTFIWTGEGYPWMQAGTQVGWDISGVRAPDRHTISIHGPIAVGTNWVFVETIDWDNSRCDGIPTTDLSIRDDLGRWYDWRSGADCSPCGEVTHTAPSGTTHDLGELCLDLSGTLSTLDAKNDFPVDR